MASHFPKSGKKSWNDDQDYPLVIRERAYILLFEKVDNQDGIIYLGVKSDSWPQYAGTTCLFGGETDIKENLEQTLKRELHEESKGTFTYSGKPIKFYYSSHRHFYWVPATHGVIADLHPGPNDELKEITGVSAIYLKQYSNNARELARQMSTLVGASLQGGGHAQFSRSDTLLAIQYWLNNIFPTLCPGL